MMENFFPAEDISLATLIAVSVGKVSQIRHSCCGAPRCMLTRIEESAHNGKHNARYEQFECFIYHVLASCFYDTL